MLLVLGVIILYSRGVAVEVRPDEAAKAAQISVSHGDAFALGGSVYAVGSDVTVAVTAPGFRDATRRLPSKLLDKTITIELQPLPGELIATTAPALEGTRWSINGVPAGVEPQLRIELDAGTHTLGADNPFFAPSENDVVMQRGETTKITMALTLVAGRLLIDSIPSGAAVLIGEETIGITPLDVARPGGAYALSLRLDGYTPSQETVAITNDAPQVTRTYRLQPLSGSLTISAKPAGGALLVNGAKVKPGDRLALPVDREHTVSYMLAGYHAKKQMLRLTVGEDRKLEINLKTAFGEVVVSSRPEADIFIDGVAKGRTPATFKLPARPAKLTLSRAGYRTVEQTIRPKAGAQISVNRKLMSERNATLAEAPPVYRNSLGMNFKLFSPASYVMGAPRHQKGQRANEFLRQVKLTRHFYAGLREVTNAQYKAFAVGHASSGGPNYPVVNIGWTDAARFCNWLSKKEGLRSFYVFVGTRYADIDRNANGYRLLSEAEWEYLARRAGRNGPVVFPWGNKTTIPEGAGNIADESAQGAVSTHVPGYNDGYAAAAPVGSFAAEPSGLHDLTGNVSEWVHDRYGLSPPAPGEIFVDPLGAAFGDIHVFKGANFRSGDRTVLRASYREGFVGGRDDIGFRLGRYLYGEKNAAN